MTSKQVSSAIRKEVFHKLSLSPGRMTPRATSGCGLVALFRATFIFLYFVLANSAAFAQEQAQRLVALLDYVGSDYKNAVQDGKILNRDEYGEMQEFSKRILELINQLKATDKADKAGIEPSLKSLARRIQNKDDAKMVADLAASIKEKLLSTYKIVLYPNRLPSLADGGTIYLENCAQCHGETGKGDGPGRESMNPKTPLPANFTDSKRMAGLSPFKAFNAATFGIEGTAMASFAALAEEQRWQVAFYLFSLRFSDESAKAGAAVLQSKAAPGDLITVATLATNSDEQLRDKIKLYAAQESQANDVLAYLRRGILERKPADPLLIARALLREATELYTKGEKEKAYQKAVEAYLDGYDLAEPALLARDASFGRALEARFTEFRASIKRGDSLADVQRLHQEINTELVRAAQILTTDNALTGGYLFLNAALIILREGLEAALILAAILAILRVMGASSAARYIHLGWILAVLAGLFTWILAETVLTFSGSQRESMEGLITIGAAVVLFYMGYWLHTKTEARKWQSFIQSKVNEALSGKGVLALVGVSFFSVYREAFEVVLFYQALWLQSPGSFAMVAWGFFAGLATLVVLVFVIFKLGLRIPLKYFFGAAGALLFLLAFVFAGSGVKELQAAGWFSATPLPFPLQVPWLGVYPTVETLAAQAIMFLVLLVALLRSARQRSAPA